jgi:hypothetical protein
MEDQSGKYFRLMGTLFLSFVAFILALGLILLGLRFIFGLLNQIPWFAYLYMGLLIFLPVALFGSIFLIYFKRTKYHPSKIIRGISYSIFTTFLLAWAIFFVLDLRTFFTRFSFEISKYHSYEMIFLIANVAAIFLIGVMQALSTEKEKDWMEKANAR